MTIINVNNKQIKDNVGNVKDLSRHPFFVKKADEAKSFLKKNGLPSSPKK